jgi:hypothetical protein
MFLVARLAKKADAATPAMIRTPWLAISVAILPAVKLTVATAIMIATTKLAVLPIKPITSAVMTKATRAAALTTAALIPSKIPTAVRTKLTVNAALPRADQSAALDKPITSAVLLTSPAF